VAPGLPRTAAGALALGLALSSAAAADAGEDGSAADSDSWWSLHFQQTVVEQHHGAFPAAYSGQNSLLSQPESKLSVTATLFLGARLWTGASLYFDPELSGGEGFSGVTGVAAFPNGEIYRVGETKPTVTVARLYYQQAFSLGGGSEAIADEANQVSERLDAQRLTLRAGRFSLTDFFDDNHYAHDPRGQFLSWALLGNGAWDYAADTRGYTWGLAADYRRPGWALRAAAVLVPKEANGLELDTRVAQAHALNLEAERGHRLRDRPGALRLIVYRNVARMGSYREALALDPASPDVVATRRDGRDKNGVGLNLEQELADDAGVFLRLGGNDGRNETWAFTEIDRTATLGVSWGGRTWGRTGDRVAAAFIANGLSSDHRDYLGHGGYGFIIGDGALRYGSEQVLEFYYSVSLPRGMTLTGDVQRVWNPAYNRDRGPVNVLGLRFHLEQ
jgi:high affinity Mn2+ porin